MRCSNVFKHISHIRLHRRERKDTTEVHTMLFEWEVSRRSRGHNIRNFQITEKLATLASCLKDGVWQMCDQCFRETDHQSENVHLIYRSKNTGPLRELNCLSSGLENRKGKGVTHLVPWTWGCCFAGIICLLAHHAGNLAGLSCVGSR